MTNILQEIQYNPQEWQEKVNKFQEIMAKAEALEKADQGDPFETKKLAEAFNLYQQSNYLIPQEKIVIAAQRCQEKINWRHQFQDLFNQGETFFNQGFFKQALGQFLEAKKIFLTEKVSLAIQNCSARLQEEKEYEKNLIKVYELLDQGCFQEAFLLLQPLVHQFPRSDGKQLFLQLQEIIAGKAYFMAGLLAEKAGNFLLAKEKYQRAIKLIPERENYLIRLGIILIKLGQLTEALNVFKNIKNEQSYYFQGFIYAQQKQWKDVYKYWQYLPILKIKKQQEIIKDLVLRERLTKIKQIEEFVNLKAMEKAQSATQDFMQKFGKDPLVKKNLESHIIPYLQSAQWKEQKLTLNQLNQLAEKQWQKNPNVISLHNLMVSQYYLFQEDKHSLKDLIFLWINTFINLENNPIIKNIAWLNYEEINQQELTQNLQELLEEYLEEVKQNNLETYLDLRDSYRREKWALILMKEPENEPIKINQIFITPGCYEKYYKQEKYLYLPVTILGTLYTPWGYAVAACLEKDMIRALTIKPASITSEIEKFAQTFVYYHLGCFYLENNQWSQSSLFLNEIKNEILSSLESVEYLDQICQKQRQNIEYFNEHLEFSQFWYNLIETPASLNYFAEYQAQKIILNLAQEKISNIQAYSELKNLEKLDPNNPVVKDLIEKLKFEKELSVINNLLNEKRFEEAIEQAKQSKYDKIKMIVAELFIHILMEGFKNNELNFNDIYTLGKWVYELYPDDSTVQEIYSFTQELSQIQNLMLNDKFDEAVAMAKYSDHNLVRQYVSNFFMKTLLSGIENNKIPPEMLKQLALWAYSLSPDTTNYQDIYESLGIIN